MLAGRDSLDRILLLSVGARNQNRQRAETVDQRNETDARGNAGDLLDENAEIKRAPAAAPVLLWIADGKKPLLDKRLVEIPRILVGLVDLRGSRSDLVLGELADRTSK